MSCKFSNLYFCNGFKEFVPYTVGEFSKNLFINLCARKQLNQDNKLTFMLKNHMPLPRELTPLETIIAGKDYRFQCSVHRNWET